MKPSILQKERIKTVLSFQFPNLNTDNLLSDIDITISRKTKRIKEVFEKLDGRKILIFVLRPNDGHFLPTFYGGQRILNTGYEGNRVVMNKDASDFISRGKSAFCKHVIRVDDGIQPNSEVFLLDPDMKLLAVGTAIQPGYAMLEFNAGIAVKPRKYKLT